MHEYMYMYLFTHGNIYKEVAQEELITLPENFHLLGKWSFQWPKGSVMIEPVVDLGFSELPQ